MGERVGAWSGSSVDGSEERSRRKMVDLAERATLLARRRFGLTVHFGVSSLKGELPVQYQEALAAAESAMSRSLPIAHAGSAAPTASPLGKLRQELGGLVEEKPERLPARFDRFLEAVALVSKYRLEPARAHLEAGFERLTEALNARGTLDQRGVENVRATVERAAEDAAPSRVLRVVGDAAIAKHGESLETERRPCAVPQEDFASLGVARTDVYPGMDAEAVDLGSPGASLAVVETAIFSCAPPACVLSCAPSCSNVPNWGGAMATVIPSESLGHGGKRYGSSRLVTA